MGGRGASSGMGATAQYSAKSKGYKTPYERRYYGQVTSTEAGQLYKAYKNGKINVLPETVSMLYKEKDADFRFMSERYSQDHVFYDTVSRATHSLLNDDFKTAEKLYGEIEKDQIRLAGKKSPYYKYKKR